MDSLNSFTSLSRPSAFQGREEFQKEKEAPQFAGHFDRCAQQIREAKRLAKAGDASSLGRAIKIIRNLQKEEPDSVEFATVLDKIYEIAGRSSKKIIEIAEKPSKKRPIDSEEEPEEPAKKKNRLEAPESLGTATPSIPHPNPQLSMFLPPTFNPPNLHSMFSQLQAPLAFQQFYPGYSLPPFAPSFLSPQPQFVPAFSSLPTPHQTSQAGISPVEMAPFVESFPATPATEWSMGPVSVAKNPAATSPESLVFSAWKSSVEAAMRLPAYESTPTSPAFAQVGPVPLVPLAAGSLLPSVSTPKSLTFALGPVPLVPLAAGSLLPSVSAPKSPPLSSVSPIPRAFVRLPAAGESTPKSLTPAQVGIGSLSSGAAVSAPKSPTFVPAPPIPRVVVRVPAAAESTPKSLASAQVSTVSPSPGAVVRLPAAGESTPKSLTPAQVGIGSLSSGAAVSAPKSPTFVPAPPILRVVVRVPAAAESTPKSLASAQVGIGSLSSGAAVSAPKSLTPAQLSSTPVRKDYNPSIVFHRVMKLEVSTDAFWQIRELFSKHPYLFSKKSERGNTILHKLFYEATTKFCRNLLKIEGCSSHINDKNNEGETPFDLACKTVVRGSVKAKIKLLHQYNANLYIHDLQEKSVKELITHLQATKAQKFKEINDSAFEEMISRLVDDDLD